MSLAAVIRSSIPLLLAPVLIGQGEKAGVDGAEAPLHTWHIAGGSSARTGVTRTPGVRGELTKAWSMDLGLPIEEEPLVWGDLVVVVTRNGDDRTVHFLRLRDGAEWITSRTFTSGLPLRPSLWNRLLALRAAPDQVVVLRLDYVGAQVVHRYSGKEGLSGPLLHGGELYVREGGDVLRFRVGSSRPLWSAKGSFAGELALRDQWVYAVGLEPRAGLLVSLSRHDGRRGATHRTDIAVVMQAAEKYPVIGEYLALLDRGTGVVGIPVQGGPDGFFSLPGTVMPATWGRELLWTADTVEHGPSLLQGRLPAGSDGFETLYLATREYHTEYTRPAVAPSIAGGIAFVGTFAFDLEERRITWRSEDHGRSPEAVIRAIPARNTLLVVRDSVLTALRPSDAPVEEPPLILGDPAVLGSLRGARAWLRDGTLLEGNLGILHEAGVITAVVSGRRFEFDLGEVLLMQDGSGEPLVVAAPRYLGEGVERVVQGEMADRLGKLVRSVLRSNDLSLIEEVVTEAQLMGAPERDVEYAQERLEGLRDRSRPPRVNRSAAGRAREEFQSLRSEAVAAAWEQLELPAAAPESVRLALLRAILELQPEYEPALDAVRERLPEGLVKKGGFPALDWLDFLEARQQVELHFAQPAKDGSSSQRALAEQRSSWRDDLMGIESERLLVMAPPDAPGGVARCVSAGELVCQALESLFAGGESVREDRDRLRILVFGSKEAYLEHSGGGQQGHLAWTAGHYSPLESISRMYLPPEDDAFSKVMPVFVHELTHHWLEERCPRISKLADVRVRSQQPGYWIVEGFASFVEEFRFDLASRTWRTEDPRSENLDILANVNRDAVLHWEAVYRASQVDMHQSLSKQPAVTVTDTWRLGQSRQLSATNMFYVQAAATCHYLFHADGGKYRQALLDYLGAWYSGKRDELGLDEKVGMTFEELGRKVLAYAKDKVP